MVKTRDYQYMGLLKRWLNGCGRLWFRVKFYFKWTYKYLKKSRKISSVKRLWFRVKFHFKWSSKHSKRLRKISSVKRLWFSVKFHFKQTHKYLKKSQKISSVRRLWFSLINNKCNHSESEPESGSIQDLQIQSCFSFFILYLYSSK